MKCYAEKYCKGYPKYCNRYCLGYIQLNNLYKQSMLPKKYRYDILLNPEEQDFDKFVFLADFKNNVVENIKKGRGLFIWGWNRGNGKTSWATKIMNEYFKKVALNNNLESRGVFVSVPDFLQRMRNEMNNPTDEMPIILDRIKNSDLVIWDDIGTENSSNWVREQLYNFINHRQSNDLSNIYTSNLSLEELENDKFLGTRIVSRIKGQCKQVEITGVDERMATW